MIRAILFDLDGTLVDRRAAHQRYCLDLVHRRPEVHAAFGRVDDLYVLLDGPDRHRHAFARRIAKAVPGLGPPARLAEDHAHKLPGFIQPDAEIVQLLHSLSTRYVLGVVSTGEGSHQRAKLDAAGLSGLFDRICISGEERTAKPHGVLFQRALSRVRTAPEEALFVGDDPAADIAGAARAGMRTCWVSGGGTYPEGVLRPDLTIRRVHYAAHQAIFAGFFPTPARPGKHPRPFALQFPGSETIGPETCVLDAPDLVTGLAAMGYHTVCIGGVGFFNKKSALGSVLPGLFVESRWGPELGVTERRSTENQVSLAAEILERLPKSQRIFLFVNISAAHQPNYFYLEDATVDTIASQAAALAYVDTHLGRLFEALKRRAPCFGILCSDHGTACGEDSFTGHRLAHPVVWTVPYAEFILREASS